MAAIRLARTPAQALSPIALREDQRRFLSLLGQLGKQGTSRRQVLEDYCDRFAKFDLWRRDILAPLRLHAHGGDRLARPIDVLGVEVGQVTLGRPEMPG